MKIQKIDNSTATIELQSFEAELIGKALEKYNEALSFEFMGVCEILLNGSLSGLMKLCAKNTNDIKKAVMQKELDKITVPRMCIKCNAEFVPKDEKQYYCALCGKKKLTK